MIRNIFARLLPCAFAVAIAPAAVVFNPGEGCVALPAQGDVTGVKCYGDFTDVGYVIHQFNGTGSGTFSTSTLPFSYDFTVNGNQVIDSNSLGTSVGSTDWAGGVKVSINGLTAGFVNLSGIFGQQMNGSFDINTPNGQVLDSWSIYIYASNQIKSKVAPKISLNIPPNSLNLPGTQVIPEPASVALVAGGLLAAGLLSRRRSQS